MSHLLIQKIYTGNTTLSDYLQSKGEISFKTDVDDTYKKVLLIAVASYLETQITEILLAYCSKATKNCKPLVSFIENKAIRRQYHTFFKWEDRSANQFFGLFGKEFFTQVKSDVSAKVELEEAVKAFLEIGDERNKMVHEDYASYRLEKTAEEVFKLYEKSQLFVTYLDNMLISSVK
jgi:hypothetical protein